MNLLQTIDSPKDLKKLDINQLTALCQEIRDYMIGVCANNPGHLGASLGTVELTVAIHYVFNTPQDKLIWDVGHQAYAHKIITGRREAFVTNRKYGGISGFPKISESPYDAFGTGHASTSISAALGMAVANELQGCPDHVIAVIGDGSMTGGLAYEGLNNAGARNTDMLVILNDNQMAIAPNVGGLHNHLLKITTSEQYNRIKTKTWHILGPGSLRWNISRLVKAVKRMLVPRSSLFQALGFRYFGPLDGHDLHRLIKTLEKLKKIQGPKLLHVLTVKGKGYRPAEQQPATWHAPGTFDALTGLRKADKAGNKTIRFQEVFGYTLLDLARQNDKIVGVTPAMPTGCSLDIMIQAMPERCFDVGIAEQHAVTFSAGLAARGMLPYCNIYSSFMQRAFDSVIHDVALQNLKVVFCLDRAGIVGEDGATHHGAFDLAYMRCIPNMTICAPMDETELRNMLYSAQTEAYTGPICIRYPRGSGSGQENWRGAFSAIERGKAQELAEGKKVAVLSLGTAGLMAARAIKELKEEGYPVGHYNMRFLKPIDYDTLKQACDRYRTLVTVEDGCLIGALHEAVCAYVAEHGLKVKVRGLGIGDAFVEHGTPALLYKACRFDTQSIKETLREILFV